MVMDRENLKICALLVTSLMVIFVVPFSHGITNEQDGNVEIPTFLVNDLEIWAGIIIIVYAVSILVTIFMQ